MNIKSSCTAICDFASDIKRGQQQFSSSKLRVSGMGWVILGGAVHKCEVVRGSFRTRQRQSQGGLIQESSPLYKRKLYFQSCIMFKNIPNSLVINIFKWFYVFQKTLMLKLFFRHTQNTKN